MLSIGALSLKSPIVLAPMAGISDLPFRLINRSFGCELAFTEMISAGSLVHKSRNTLRMLKMTETDRPLGVQILGGEHEVISHAMDLLAPYGFDIIDFNAACPVKKVVSAGQGSALLREPERLERLLKLIVGRATRPVTVKIRAGWDMSSVNAVDISRRAEDAGVHGIFIHGRTRMQGYSGSVDYDIIRKVKESAGVPVIASGDAFSPALVMKLFNETGCDGVAIARGSFGNPWIFRETEMLLKLGAFAPRPGVCEIAKTMREHLDLNISHFGERSGVILFRKFFVWYARGMAAKELKIRAFRAGTGQEMLSLIEELKTLPPTQADGCMYYGKDLEPVHSEL